MDVKVIIEDLNKTNESENGAESASSIDANITKLSLDTTSNQNQDKQDLEIDEPETKEKSTEIRLDISLANRFNNVVHFPDLLKEAGIEIAKTPPRYLSDSESIGSESPQSEWSDFGTPDDLRTQTPPLIDPLPPPTFQAEGNEFFERILENAEKYAIGEEEKTRKEKKTRITRDQQYDLNDPFIDDSELVPLQRDYGKVRPQVEGFYVWRGPLALERLDEDKSSPKKKAPTKRKQKSAENEVPKVRRTRTTKKTEDDSNVDGKVKPSVPKKRVSKKKAKIAANSNQESTFVNGNAETPCNNTNGSMAMVITPTCTSNSTAGNSDGYMSIYSKTLSNPNKTPGKKKKIYSVESIHPDVLCLLDAFKQLVDKESFEVKSRFPPNLRPPLLELVSRTYELNHFNENFFKILTNMLPYNKFTVTRLCQRTLYPKTLIELQRTKYSLINELEIEVGKIMPSMIQEFNERNVMVSMSENACDSDIDSMMEVDGDVDVDIEPDVDGGFKSDSKSDSSSNNRPSESVDGRKFRWDDKTKGLLWKIVQAEMTWVATSNSLAEAEERSERHSEQTMRKSLYQDLLKVWPNGWMTSYEIAQLLMDYSL